MPDSCRYCSLSDGKNLYEPADPNAHWSCLRLSELEKRIMEVRMMLSDLEIEYRALKEKVNHNHDRLIHRLPTEIAAEIFKFCIPEDVMDLDLQSLSEERYTVCAPLILSAVCRRWRDVAHSTPELWTTLALCIQDSSFGSLSGPFLVQEWLDRSGQFPLSISFFITKSRASRDATGIQIIHELNKYSDRWLNLKYEGPPHLLSYFSGDELPQLRTLQMKTHLGYPNHYAHINFIKLNPQRLQSLSITGAILAGVQLDWTHLTQLVMEFAPLSECLEVLRRAPLLAKCTFGRPKTELTYSGHLAFPLPQKPILHPGIQYLELTGPLYMIFEHLLCPFLKALVLNVPSQPIHIPIPFGFLEDSGCCLESLSLVQGDLNESEIAMLCEQIPTLRHLSLELFNSFPALQVLFTRLAEFSTSNGVKEPLYLPHLRSLSLDHNTFDSWTMLPDIFVTSYAHTSCPAQYHRLALESVSISVFRNITNLAPHLVHTIDEETLMKILRLRESGVKWKIQFGWDKYDMISIWIEHYGVSY